MTNVRQAVARVVSFLCKKKLDWEFGEELAAHIDLATQDYLRRGVSPAEAHRRALIALGGIEASKELHRDSRGLPGLDGILQDVRYAVRGLKRSPGFTLTAMAIIAVSVGINTTVFTAASAVLFKGYRFIDRNDRILYLRTRDTNRPEETVGVSYPDFQDWRAQAHSFQWLAACTDVDWINFSDSSGFAENYWAVRISTDTFRLIGQKPVLGRDFVASDAIPGAAPVVILTYGVWETRYGKDPAVIGRTVRINGAPATVIGVMPQGFTFPNKQDVWMPLVATPAIDRRDARNGSLFFAFGRLTDNATLAGARAELDTIGQRLARAHPLTNRDFLPAVQTFHEMFHGPRETLTYTSMWGAVVFVLLIACANLANLMLARAMGRSREVSLRLALGAGRWRIIRQLLVESVTLSAAGGFLGWWLAKWGVRVYALTAYSQYHPAATPGIYTWHDFTMDYRILAYAVAMTAGTAILFGLTPARRLSKLDVSPALKSGGRGAIGFGSGNRGRHLSFLLVISEMALAVVLLAGAGVMIRSFLNLQSAHLGANTKNVVAAYLDLPDTRYPGGQSRVSFYDRLAERLQSIPGVESVTFASRPPAQGRLTFPYELARASPMDRRTGRTVSALIIGSTYFRTLQARILSGRAFNDADRASSLPVVIVNRRFAREHWPGANPLGKRLRLLDGRELELSRTVVGVASNIVQNPDRQTVEPIVYLPYRQLPTGFLYVLARTHTPRGSLVPEIRREIQALDPDIAISDFETLAVRVSVPVLMFFIFATLALVLASVGLYAVVAYSVNRRRQEFGVRIAVGAAAQDIRNLVLRQAVQPLAIGLAAGLAGALALNRVLQAQLVGVSPGDPLTLTAATVLLVVSGLLGCWLPAQRATRVDPAVALRHE